MSYFSFMFLLVVFFMVLKFIFNNSHLLVSLLCLEFASLTFFMIVGSNLYFWEFESVFLLFFLVMVVCEGVLGLCLLIYMSFIYSSDYLFMYNKLSC